MSEKIDYTGIGLKPRGEKPTEMGPMRCAVVKSEKTPHGGVRISIDIPPSYVEKRGFGIKCFILDIKAYLGNKIEESLRNEERLNKYESIGKKIVEVFAEIDASNQQN